MVDATNNAASLLQNFNLAEYDLRYDPGDLKNIHNQGIQLQALAQNLQNLQNLQGLPEGTSSQAGTNQAPPGAPALSPPQKQYSPEEMTMMVSELMAKLDDAQSQAQQNGLQTDNDQRQEAFKKSNDAIAAAQKKLAEAAHKQKILGPLATIGKVFAGIAAIALTVATGGLAAPLAIAIVAYTVVDTALTVANAISQAKGGPALDTGSLLNKGFTALAKKCGASDSEAQKIGEGFSIGIQAAIAVATIVASVASVVSLAKGAAQMGGLASKLGATAFKLTKITGVASQLIGGATTMAAGGMSISAAVDTKAAADANADKAQFDATSARLEEQIKNILDKLQLIASDLNSNMQNAAQVVAEVGKTNDAIAGGNVSMV